MKQFNRTNLLDRAQRRLRRARPGTVLILVVALLILMAIIGTAYMSMAQSDRATAATHTNNTEIDLLLDGVVNMIKGNIVGELYAGGGKFRNAQQLATSPQYQNWNGIGFDNTFADVFQSPGSLYLADRTPDVPNRFALATPRGGGNEPYWPFITSPVAGTQFSTPYWNPNAQAFLQGQVFPATVNGDPWHYTQRDSDRFATHLVPGFAQLPSGTYPAWVDPNNPADPNHIHMVLAADTDGDGAADAGYVKLPIGSINGVTYYAAVRIIDNAAAVNVNTATWPNGTNTIDTTSLYGDYFPTSVNLQRMLAFGDNLAVNPVLGQPALLPYRTSFATGVTPPVPPIDDTGIQRADFSFLKDPASTAASTTSLDALWMQLGRRLDNPGYYAFSGGKSYLYQSLGIGESIYLARNFILRDPSVSTANFPSSPSIVERALPQTTLNGRSTPYTLFDTSALWFQQNFNFWHPTTFDNLAPDQGNGNGLQTQNTRALLVARNPVTNFAPNKYNPIPGVIPTTGGFGDEVKFGGRAYVYIGPPTMPPQPLTDNANFLPIPSATNPQVNNSLFWVPEPFADAPTKINVNTATFGQLYTAYWSTFADFSNRDVNGNVVMFDGITIPPAGQAGSEFRQFYSPLRDPTAGTIGTQAVPTTPDNEPRPVHRATRRYTTVSQRAFIPTSETIKLRAALAAVNSLALRNPADPSLPYATVLLGGQVFSKAAGGYLPSTIEATVFGSKPQPYIVQLYAENDKTTLAPAPVSTPNPQGYVGIELYNPYPFAITLDGCQLGLIVGRDYSAIVTGLEYPNMKIQPLGVPGNLFTGFTGATIPANGYMVLENFNSSGSIVTPGANDATYRPALMGSVPGVVYYYVPNLSMVMRDPANPTTQPGGELVLLRPRKAYFNASGMNFAVGAGAGYNELLNLYDMAPLDSFDFTGMHLNTGTTDSAATTKGIYYHRSTAASVAGGPSNWRFVYPGRWASILALGHFGSSNGQSAGRQLSPGRNR